MAKVVKDRKIIILALVVLIIAYASSGISLKQEQKQGGILQQKLHVNVEVTPDVINLNVACESSYKPFAKITGMMFNLDPCALRYD